MAIAHNLAFVMDGRAKEIFKCELCYFQSEKHKFLVHHVVKKHKHDPRFKIKCSHCGCGAVFTKWKSYQRHVARKHPEAEIQSEPPLTRHNEDCTFEEGPNVPPRDRLEWCSAQFLIHIRENCRVSQTCIDSIIDGVRDLWRNFSTIILDELYEKVDAETNLIHRDEVKRVITETFPAESIFSNVDTKYKLDRYLVSSMNMIMPEKSFMGKDMVWKRQTNQADLVEVERNAWVVPLRDTLRMLLENECIRNCVDHPRVASDHPNVLETVTDGSYYRSHEFFSQNQNALAIILYYDDVEIVNPLGSKTTTHKLSMFYWTLANIYPEMRSSLQANNLFAIVQTRIMKKFGIDKILNKFVAEINMLQTEGITVNIAGVQKTYRGSLLFVAGDTPASALLGGFKESVSAYRPCRTCMTTRSQWQHSFAESRFILRTKNMHNDQLNIITENELTNQGLNFWKRRYGLNRKSALINIKDFDVTVCLPQDCMHILAEGVIETATRALLRYCVIDKRYLQVEELNTDITKFNFGHLQKDIPSPILQSHLMENSKLRQSASQMLTLANTLPFLLRGKVDELDQDTAEKLECHGRLLQILNVCLSYRIHKECVDMLENMIHVYILVFNRLYPCQIVPKFHFLIHVPRYIRLFGPARQQWCFRFESAHAYFKSLVPVLHNFKNIPYSLAYRHQALQCSRLAKLPGAPDKKFLYTGDQIFAGDTVFLESLPNAPLFHPYLEENEINTCKMFRTSKVITGGVTYKKNSVILLKQCTEESLPIFGEVREIFVYNGTFFFVHVLLDTLEYQETLNAYRVQYAAASSQKILKELIFPHPVLSVTLRREKYVVLLNNCCTEFSG